jgi:hypothetical protein
MVRRQQFSTGVETSPEASVVFSMLLCSAMRFTPIASVLLLGLLAAGCQQEDMTARTEEAEQKICMDLAEVGTALEGVAALTPESTVGDAKEADEKLAAAAEALQGSEQELEKLRLEAFKSQLKEFRGEVAKVAKQDGITLAEAATELQGKAQPVIAARAQLSEAVNCEEVGTP